MTFDPSAPDQPQFRAYGKAPEGDVRDAQVTAVISAASALDVDAFAQFARRLSARGKNIFGVYAERMAGQTVRHKDRARLVNGLIAVVLSGLPDNDYDALMAMALLEDAARRIDVRFEDVLDQVAILVGPDGRAAFDRWLRRVPADRTPDCMNFRPEETADGFEYVWKG